MEEIFNQIKVFFEQNPRYTYLMLSAVFLIFGIGNFMNKDWAIAPANSTQKSNYDFFGHNAFRLGKGIIYIIGFAVGIIGFLTTLE